MIHTKYLSVFVIIHKINTFLATDLKVYVCVCVYKCVHVILILCVRAEFFCFCSQTIIQRSIHTHIYECRGRARVWFQEKLGSTKSK